MPNPITANRRHYEDLALGEVIELAPTTVTKQMIFDFAREFDPLPFHLDEAAANASLLRGLASSGWQTLGLTLARLSAGFLNSIASEGGLGFTDLKWKRPNMVDDTISGTATISALRRSKSRPASGIITLDLDVRNQRCESIMTMQLANLITVRHPERMPMHELPYDSPSGHEGAQP
ncbi:MAG: MaoC family dehydratase [Devosia sp.]|uniref:MaoC/PaaZ C-terminal domain-containing protein n=1 Tax=Devosia sp. TaxID=1871048 RepID=UPI00263895B5|nr:MaoC/PaaZ C-terminal domain-containing protein [Devosia sp.]MDB5528962.1 MaoC family dehydratase [Devosia sp.]